MTGIAFLPDFMLPRPLLPRLIYLVCLLLVSVLPCLTQAAELRQYRYRQVAISVCRADPERDHITMYWKDGAGTPLGTFTRLESYLRSQGQAMLCATNAGIYDKLLQPLGLYIEAGHVLRRLNTRQNAYGNFYLQPNGVFAIGDGRAWIVDTAQWAQAGGYWNSQARFATQSGPLMLVGGQINARFAPDSPNAVVRNAACLDGAGVVNLAIARNPISFYDFAVFLRDQLKCVDALYLDGSISRMSPTLETNIGPAFGAMIAVTRPLAR